jgi:hypothetical protein
MDLRMTRGDGTVGSSINRIFARIGPTTPPEQSTTPTSTSSPAVG